MKSVLCAVEAVNLNTLMIEHDLSTARGGGLAVLKIGDGVAEIPGAKLVSSGASQGLIILDAQSAASAEKKVREQLKTLHLMEHATVMVAACEAGDEKDDKFQQRVDVLKSQIHWDQMRSPALVYPKLEGRNVCEIDGVRPASEQSSGLSAFTHGRRKFGRTKKKSLLKEILRDEWQDFTVVSDLNKLADATGLNVGNAAGKIAVLRFDGNDFEKRFRECDTPDRLTKFGATRVEEQEDYIRSLLREKPAQWLTSNEIRLEIVVYGGDEVQIIVPAWLGWKALRAFYSRKFDDGISYSGGLVFCHAKAPIHSIKRLANDLTDRAKDYAKESTKRGAKKGNFVLYQPLESFDAIGGDLDEWMDKRYPKQAGSTEGALLAIEEIKLLDDNMSYWKKAFSKRKLYDLAGEILKGSADPWSPQVLHAKLEKLLDAKGSSLEKISGPISQLHDKLGKAAFLHILELWDYTGLDL
jgi:hypothetical protein